MSRRAHLHNLVSNLRRYLAWQKAQGVVGVVRASADAREEFEKKRAEIEKQRIKRLHAELTAEDAGESISRAPTGDRERKAEIQEEDSGQEVKETEQRASAMTAKTPLWKKHQAMYEVKAQQRKRRAVDSSPVGEVMAGGEAMEGQQSKPETPEEKLSYLREYLGDCRRCPLHQGRTQIVFGEGSARARLMFIGEGPGFHEDQQGRPFVGKSGQLLTKMIEAMGCSRDEVYIANVIKCRPENNRDPVAEEIRQCAPFLKKQIQVVEPEVIVTLGRFAATTLLRKDEKLGALRGRWHEYEGVGVMPTYHPAYLLRSPDKKKIAWTDLQMVMSRLGMTGKK